MNMSLFPCLLILHLTGLILMAGTTFIDYIGYRTFWKLRGQDEAKSAGVLQLLGKFSRLMGIGAALLIFTGIGMMAITNGVFGEQLWFRIKFVFVVLLIGNALLFGRRNGLKLQMLIDNKPADSTAQIARVKANLTRYHIAQLLIFFVIIILSVFKFN